MTKRKTSLGDRGKKVVLPAAVFITGAAVLVIEVVATRILSPYFGNTIFTVSSVISVVLAALSCGYVIGGKLSDKRPQASVFFGIIAASGLSVLLLQIISDTFLPQLGEKLSLSSGPLVSAVILFFLPSLLMGMLSPFAIKLQSLQAPKQGIGSVAGTMFFWSTLGSIFGSLSAGFLLIPHFGISRIVVSVGAVLIVLGLVPLATARKFRLVAGAGAAAIILASISSARISTVLYEHDGVYERLRVVDITYKGRPTRLFEQDRSISGGMHLDDGSMAFDYTKYYSLYKTFQPQVSSALVIGGGAFTIPKALLHDLPAARVTVSEIEPSLYSLSQRYFDLSNDPRLTTTTEDGRRLLQEKPVSYDMIFSDVYYSLFSIPPHFTTEEFFTLAKSRLQPGGLFVGNLIGDLSRQSPSFILSEMRTFQQVFPNSYFFAVDGPGASGTQNILLVGYKSDRIVDLALQGLIEKAIDPRRFELSSYPILTDDFSPVEDFTAYTLKRSSVSPAASEIQGENMLALVAQQLRYGSRSLSSRGHQKVQDMISTELKAYTPAVTSQSWSDDSAGKTDNLTNIVARFNPENTHRIILGAHYDTKRFASLDKNNPNAVMPGANDGASGVAVLLELARYFSQPGHMPRVGVDLVFFDGEEGKESLKNDYTSWQPLGSAYFAAHLSDFYPDTPPSGGLIADMVCDKDLRMTPESDSQSAAYEQYKRFFEIGRGIDPKAFSDQSSQDIIDDHTALNNAGVPSFLVIDFTYPAFHTTKDTLDKCSAKSLQTIANTVSNYVYSLQ